MENIIDFIKNCTDGWHTAAEVVSILADNGFTVLDEGESWDLKPGGKYCVLRNMSSVIAFKLPNSEIESYMIAAAHGESPSFKIKSLPEIPDPNYVKLNIEGYGSMRLESWLDRPLSVSGRVVVENGNTLETRLVRIERDALIIPSVADHLERSSEGGRKLNIQTDMPPLYAMKSSEAHLMDEIAECVGVSADRIIGHDLMLYNREEGRIWGQNNEFISAPRLDDLQCVYAVLKGFLNCGTGGSAQLLCVFDNEEVGSGTKQGAKSDFLPSVLTRISETFGQSRSDYLRALNSSFMVSADNGHAVHPNRREASDSVNFPVIGGGVVIKYNASQRYTTDAVSEAVLKKICEAADIPYQVYANRSDIAGGSTLGNLAAEKTSINTVDIGLAQLAMHSAFETAGTADTEYLAAAMKQFYNSHISCSGGTVKVEF